ncbi:HNH endonuclease [Sorangium cellulosum]|uniref:HNH endonuclease n=1 Tax=Sorangium cellulosum TaxID=56 RepID=A0A150Q2K5_SORCE|nr:HNH endonuclease [Sorangium cellulosum]
MKAARRRLILDIVATDATFERTEIRGQAAWAGKCIHCLSHVVVGLDGEPIQRATIEHIVPRTHGGTDALDNLALACGRCNALKGMRLDVRRRDDPKLVAVIERLRERKASRRRVTGA